MQRHRFNTSFFSSPVRLAGFLIAVIFLAETIIMLFLAAGQSRAQTLALALADAAILAVLILPVIWWFIIRPLQKTALKEKARAEDLHATSILDWEDTFSMITDMITIHDKDFNIIRANRAAREKLNLPQGPPGAVKCFQFFHGAICPPADCPTCMSVRTGLPSAAERYEPHLDMYVETRAIPRFDADGKLSGMIHVVRDITKRKRIEESIENQKRFAEDLIQNSAVATFVLDPGHKVVLWNKACEELTGITAKAMLGTDDHWRPFYDRKRPTLADIVIDGAFESLSSLYPRHARSSLTENGVHAEGWYLNLNRKNRYMIFDAAPVYGAGGKLLVVIETLQDIPDRRRIEEELASSESKLRTLIEAEQDCVMLLAPDGTILEMNPAGLGMIDAGSLEQATGRSLYPLIITRYVPQVRALLERVFRGETGTLEFEFAGLKGSRRWIETRAVPLPNARGEVSALLAIARDITEKKKLESQLRHAQKMEAVGTLTGGIAHDFNNILTSIIGYGDLLRMTARDEAGWEAYVDQILASAERAANLTQNLLTFSRKQLMIPKRIDLNAIIRRVEKLLYHLIGEDIEFSLLLSQQELTVFADVGQMEQVLMNLAVNARDAMEEGGGRLLLSTGTVEIDDAWIAARGHGKAGTYAVVTVSDTGAGMDEKTRERIFEPFFTTKEVGKGTGLGLSIVYGIVKQHNGYIDCESAVGLGTTFAILLPLIAPGADEAHALQLDDLKRGTETILVTEDDAAVRGLTRTMLEHLGYAVLTAADGEEAVAAFRENMDGIDLLLFDVIMPKKNGKQAYDEIRMMRPGIKTLFTSGYTADVINRKGLLEEGMHLISKPVSLRDLSKRVREVLDGP